MMPKYQHNLPFIISPELPPQPWKARADTPSIPGDLCTLCGRERWSHALDCPVAQPKREVGKQ